MKIFIIGMHSSGKEEIITYLQQLNNKNINIGKIFTNNTTDNIYSFNYLQYDDKDIIEIFNNQAYLFLENIVDYNNTYYEGLTLYEYEKNNIFSLSPNNVNNIINIPQDTYIVWLDTSLFFRQNFYNEQLLLNPAYEYDFKLRENIETKDLQNFTNMLYSNNNILYFNNEQPLRVAVIIETIINHPDTLKSFKTHFNS